MLDYIFWHFNSDETLLETAFLCSQSYFVCKIRVLVTSSFSVDTVEGVSKSSKHLHLFHTWEMGNNIYHPEGMKTCF